MKGLKTIHIDEDLHKKMKQEALDFGVNMRELIEIKLKRVVSEEELSKIKK